MASGIPVRLSEQLTARARAAAADADRSLTEQVEHWARLGQAVEDVVLASTVRRLKELSHDPQLDERLAHADTPAGQASAAAFIRERNPVMYGVDAAGRVRAVRGRRRRGKKR